jgi:hypothetical protein
MDERIYGEKNCSYRVGNASVVGDVASFGGAELRQLHFQR